MKILLISGHRKDWDAGSSTVYLHLDEVLRQRGEDCTLLNAEDYTPPRSPDIVNKMTAAMRVQKQAPLARTADVVEVAGNIGWRLFRDLRRLPSASRPLLVTRLHGLEFKDEQVRITEEIAQQMVLPRKYKAVTRHWLNWQEFATLTAADVVICHTTRESDAMVTAGLKSEDRIRVLPLGVDDSYFAPRMEPNEGTRLLWWGSWVDRKGIFILPRAFELACRERPGLTLTIGGSGSKPDALLPLFAPSVRSRVTVLPFVSRDEHLETLRRHDIFVFPSLSEGFGLALLEAMASGLPAITTFTGLAYDWLEHGQNAFLVPMNAATALARAIVRMSDDAGLRQALSEKGQATARQLTWKMCGEQTKQVYVDYQDLLHRSQKQV